jgi:crotonobetainyl-CoA:carnitine CoA-transferase CaiB-like acyl-CoA transferase/2-hydroxychromene-2-carboxylate isomerase
MPLKVEFLFDFGSPNAYLAELVLPGIERRTGVKFEYVPVLLGGIFKATGNMSPFDSLRGIKNKPEYQALETQRFIRRHNATKFQQNPFFPVNTLMLMRGAVAARFEGMFEPYFRAAYHHMWEEPKMDDLETYRNAFISSGIDIDRLIARAQQDDVKKRLIDLTTDAVNRGAFGSPTFFVGKEMFFGKDQLRDVEASIVEQASQPVSKTAAGQELRPAEQANVSGLHDENSVGPHQSKLKGMPMPGPLSGVRVLDLTGVVSGPFATMFLADQGADVLKIEAIGGDITRRSRATIDKDGEFSALFISSNRGKRSLSIDVKSAAGREVLAKLVAQADVLVQNFRPGTMERLGLGVDELRQRHPRLIYVSISGVGDTGPYVKKRVYDPIIQGLSGFADIQSQPVTNRPQMIRTIVCDKTTAVFTAQAVAAALYAREKSGQGDHIQVAMLDAMISYLWPEGMMQYTVVGTEATAADPNDRPDLVFKTSDGYITAGTISDSEWQGFCRASGDPELAKDLQFATPSARSVNATARINKMAEYIGQHTTAEWLERLDAADVPCAPILRRGEIIHNEQVIAREIIAEFDQPKVGRVRQPKPAARFEINAAAIGGPAPRVGEHSRDVLRELGYDDGAIDKMVAERCVREAI